MLEEVTHGIIGCAMRVHNTLGHGFPEVIYQRTMELEMAAKGMVYEREKELPINYRGKQIGVRRVDFFVEGKVMVELKAINRLEEVHIAQALNYLETYQMPVGLLINFGKRSLEFKRVHHHRGGEQAEHRGRKRDLRGMLNEEVWRRSCICIRWRRRRSKPANI
jgi:GxxExxY protein